jgi:hypothetical protein
VLRIGYDHDAASVHWCSCKDVWLKVVSNRFQTLEGDLHSSESGGAKSVEVTFDIQGACINEKNA